MRIPTIGGDFDKIAVDQCTGPDVGVIVVLNG